VPDAEIVDEETPPAAPVVTLEAPASLSPAPPAPEPAEVDAAAPSPPSPEPPPREEISLDRCAAVAASIARTPHARAQILEVERLSAEDFSEAERHWSELLLAEGRRGKRALLEVYDAAFVARLEEERGPIEVAEYARLVVASERGAEAATLADLGLPRGATMRIERVWLRKVRSEPALAKAVTQAVKAAREA